MSFFKVENDLVQEAPNFVHAPEYDLVAESKDDYSYPVDGWTWFDTLEEAYKFFGVALPDITLTDHMTR
jgi:hypothetical protein